MNKIIIDFLLSDNKEELTKFLDKELISKIEKELVNKDFSPKAIKNIFENLEKATPDQNLKEIFSAAEKLGVPQEFCKFEPFLSRGLDYYTGVVFETAVTKPQIGSVTGGGRYDQLVGKFIGQDIPATGTSLVLTGFVM